MEHLHHDFREYPKLRHNLWTNYEDSPDITYLSASHGQYQVKTSEANDFLKIRSYCTGHHRIDAIAEKSQLSKNEVYSMISSLDAIDLLHLPFKPLETVSTNQLINTLLAATDIWREQLSDTHISQRIFQGKTSSNVVIGWLLETYHYIKQFPGALEMAAERAQGSLQMLLSEYAKQEAGHEFFIMQTLLKAGLSRAEVENSIPLVSTRTIDLLLRELFILEPAAVLLVAGIIEADDYHQDAAHQVARILHETHGFPLAMMTPFFKHVDIDSKLGHQQLLKNNRHLLQEINLQQLHDIVNKLHDIKHAFDLQKLEIFDYYDKPGNYMPRQRVDFFAI